MWIQSTTNGSTTLLVNTNQLTHIHVNADTYTKGTYLLFGSSESDDCKFFLCAGSRDHCENMMRKITRYLEKKEAVCTIASEEVSQ